MTTTAAAQWQVTAYGGPYTLGRWTLTAIGDSGTWTLTDGRIERQIGRCGLYSAIDRANEYIDCHGGAQ